MPDLILRRLALMAMVIAVASPALAADRARKPEPPRFPDEILASDPALRAREQKVQEMLVNATARDVSGQVMAGEALARDAWAACRTRACLNAWYAQRERALGIWEGN